MRTTIVFKKKKSKKFTAVCHFRTTFHCPNTNELFYSLFPLPL